MRHVKALPTGRAWWVVESGALRPCPTGLRGAKKVATCVASKARGWGSSLAWWLIRWASMRWATAAVVRR